jgi:hypothetical protein
MKMSFAQVSTSSNNNIQVIEDISMVIPYEATEIESGELYKVKVVSKKDYADLTSFKNKRINEVMFVTEVIDNPPDGILFEVFVTTPPKGKKEEKYSFKYEGFKYKNDKKDLQGDLKTLAVINPFDFTNFKFDRKYQILISIALFIALLGLIVLIRKLFHHRKKKKLFSLRAKELIELIKTAETKTDFENIYREKKQITKYVDIDEKAFIKFISTINDYQFRESWNEEYSLKIKRLSKALDIKGVNRGV